jgi:Na+/proline symporter
MMSERLGWLLLFLALYATYCVFWGVDCARGRRGAMDFFLGERGVPSWAYAAAATAASFTGWMALGLPATIFRDGFPAASIALGAIVIPLAGALVLSRQWILSRRFGFVTLAEMYADYFGDPLIRPIVLGVALLFALPFLGMQMAATGLLLQVLSNGLIPWVFGMWGLGALVFVYVVLGGMRAAAFVGVLQALLFGAAIVATGVIAWVELGGFGSFVGLLAKLGASKVGDWGASTGGYNALFTTPGVVQFVAGFGKESPVGGVWTTSMVLSTALSLMGLQLAPAFAIAAFSTRDARGFAPQQVWLAAAAVGFGLVFFSVIAGVGALFLGASPAINQASLAISHDLPALEGGHEAGLIAHYLNSLAVRAPWFLGLLAVAAAAATQATAALYISATGTMFARDFYRHYLRPTATDRDQKLFGRIGVGFTMLFSLLGATYAPQAQAEIGALALSAALQLLPLALAVCWFPWITPRAATSGLIAGLIVVLFTDKLGITLADFFEIDIPWGRWPWTVHSAGWGIVCNVAVCLLFSLLTQKRSRREHRMRFHDYLAEAAARAPNMRVWSPVAWAAALGWFFFAIGPGLLFGVDLFGAPNAGPSAWLFGIPSIWAWQIIAWALGVLLLWLVAYRLGMSRPPPRPIEMEAEAIRRTPRGSASARPREYDD